MTHFLSLRSQGVGGPVVRPGGRSMACNGAPPYQPVTDAAIAADVAGRDVVLAIHGFNVNRTDGVAALSGLEAALALPPNFRFYGVLWPGDFWLPVVNYPWEGSRANESGRYLAAYCNVVFANAASISFISHSLGGRVLLEAVANLDRPATQLCIAAGAVDDDCLYGQYLAVKNCSGRVAVLSSKGDKVLRLAYPAGDFISDLFLGDKDSPWRSALGFKGPRPTCHTPVVGEPIPLASDYGHSDYLPPDPASVTAAASAADAPKWSRATAYMRRIVTGQANYW